MSGRGFRVQGLGEIAIRCANFEAMLAFYRDVIGLEVMNLIEERGIAFNNCGKFIVATTEAQVATRATKTGHLAVAATEAGTAEVAAMALSPGTSTLGTSNIQLDTTKESLAPLDSIMLPMTPDTP